MKLLFNNCVGNWEEVEANPVDINGRKYFKFTPADGRYRIVRSDNPYLTLIEEVIKNV